MQGFKNVLQLIFYLIWIPLGFLLFVIIIFLIISNPLSKLSPGGFGGSGGSQSSFGPPSGDSGFPSEDMMKQYMQQGENRQPSQQR